MLQPLHVYVLADLYLRQSVQIGHEDLQAGLRSHAGVTVHQLVLIVIEIEIEPGVIRQVHHDQVHVMHGEFSKIDGAVVEPQKISPFFHTGHRVFGISKDFFDVRTDHATLVNCPRI